MIPLAHWSHLYTLARKLHPQALRLNTIDEKNKYIFISTHFCVMNETIYVLSLSSSLSLSLSPLQLAQFDPVRVFPLHKHITSKLEQCAAVHGDHGYLTLMTSVDIVIREQLFEFIVPREVAWTLLALPTQAVATATVT